MKQTLRTLVVGMLSVALLLSSPGCFGSFNLVKKVYKFNEDLGGKWVQEIGFLVMSVIPIYGGAAFIDAVILNTIEFWSGTNPVSSNFKSDDGSVQIAQDRAHGSIQLTQGNARFVFEKSDEGTIVRNEDGKFLVRCIAGTDGNITLKNEAGATVAEYSAAQVQNLYASLERVK